MDSPASEMLADEMQNTVSFSSFLISSLNFFQGIMHNTKPVFTAQFHPEAKGGPTDTEVIKDFAARST